LSNKCTRREKPTRTMKRAERTEENCTDRWYRIYLVRRTGTKNELINVGR